MCLPYVGILDTRDAVRWWPYWQYCCRVNRSLSSCPQTGNFFIERDGELSSGRKLMILDTSQSRAMWYDACAALLPSAEIGCGYRVIDI